MPHTLLQNPQAPIRWIHGVNTTCWNTQGLGYVYHFVLHAQRVQGKGVPYFPMPPKRETPDGHAKCVASLLGAKNRETFMLSLPETVRSFFVCKRESGNNGCQSTSVMKGHIVSGDEIHIVSGADIARMQAESQIVREAMQAYRKTGRYVNGEFSANKKKFTLKTCKLEKNTLDFADEILKPHQFGSVKLIYGIDRTTSAIVDAVYVVKGNPVVVLARDPFGTIIHKELPVSTRPAPLKVKPDEQAKGVWSGSACLVPPQTLVPAPA